MTVAGSKATVRLKVFADGGSLVVPVESEARVRQEIARFHEDALKIGGLSTELPRQWRKIFGAK